MDLYTAAYYLSLYLAPIVVYAVATRRSRPLDLYYRKPEWYHWVKAKWAQLAIVLKRFRSRDVDEEFCERPKNEAERQKLVFMASDFEKNSLYCEMEAEEAHQARVVLRLTFKQKIYEASYTSTFSGGKSEFFRCGGLKISPLEPFRSVRLCYNGLANKSEHLRCSFIFSSDNDPIFWPDDAASDLLADALAKEPWRNGRWMEMIGRDVGFEQFGSLSGAVDVSGEESSEQRLHLMGHRRHSWGAWGQGELHRDVALFGMSRDGAVYCVGAKSYRSGCRQLCYGSVRKPDGESGPIEECDLDLEQLPNHRTNFTVHLKARGTHYKIVTFASSSTASHFSTWGWRQGVMRSESSINDKECRGLVHFGRQTEETAPPSAQPKRSFRPSLKAVLGLAEEESCSEALVGGKASCLAQMVQMERPTIQVPPGFTITTAAFRAHLEDHPHLVRALDSTVAIATKKKPGSLQEACQELQKLFKATPISGPTRTSILSELERLRSGDALSAFAVRSSAIGEDSEGLSAAGQNRTLLGCCAADEVLAAVADCWASLYSLQSLSYRLQHGQSPTTEMGVVVQRLVPADAAGVLFTCLPANGDPRTMLISANFGLGESVVSSEADPDQIFVRKDNLLVERADTGDKKTFYELRADGCGYSPAPPGSSQRLSLSQDQIQAIAKIGVELEDHFGGARDIEFAFVQDTAFVLQCRPVTTLFAWSDVDLLHELDSAIMSEEDVFTFANTGEVLPGALTALTSSTIARICDQDIQASELLGLRSKSKYAIRCMLVTHHRVALNVLNCLLKNCREEISLADKVSDFAVCGHVLRDELMHQRAIRRHGTLGTFQKAEQTVLMLMEMLHGRRCDQKASSKALQFRIERSTDLKLFYDEISRSLNVVGELLQLHGTASRCSIFYQVVMMMVLAEGGNDLTADHHRDMATLLGSCQDVVSAQVPVYMERVAAAIRAANKHEEFADLRPDEARDWLKQHCPPANRQLEQFLSKFGHRCLKEFDLSSKTWEMDSGKLMRMVQAVVKGEVVSKEHSALSGEETVQRLASPQRRTTRPLLRLLVGSARAAVAKRERTKDALVRAAHQLRLAYRRLGEDMQHQAFLPEAELVFHMTHYELSRHLRHRDPELVIKATRRRRLLPQWDNMNFPETCFHLPAPLPNQTAADLGQLAGAVAMCGTPVCEGRVVGRACVVLSLEDADQLKPGDILITKSTDIGWSPYFAMLSGVVTELGGLISHGAVVAREYGLPCIVGLGQATKVFRTGDIVLLSGSTGDIEKIGECNSQE